MKGAHSLAKLQRSFIGRFVLLWQAGRCEVRDGAVEVEFAVEFGVVAVDDLGEAPATVVREAGYGIA